MDIGFSGSTMVGSCHHYSGDRKVNVRISPRANTSDVTALHRASCRNTLVFFQLIKHTKLLEGVKHINQITILKNALYVNIKCNTICVCVLEREGVSPSLFLHFYSFP